MSVLKIKNSQGNWINIPTIKGENATLDVIADEYSSSVTYALGDYCIYDNNLYKCTTAIVAAEVWTSGHWTQITVSDEISQLKSDLTDFIEDFGSDVDTAVDNWLDAHPEATTTVQDGSLTLAKFTSPLQETVETNANSAILGLHGYSTEALAEADASGYASGNLTILQTALDNGKVVVLGKGFFPVSDEISLPLSFTIKGLDKYGSALVFPNSRGLAFDRAGYYSNFLFDSFSIISGDSCISARDGTNRPVPENVYQGTFKNLYLKAATGNCIESSYRNYAAVGSQLFFEVSFDEITVTALEGDGFVDLFGLGIVFSRCNDRTAIRYVFRNCTGKWNDINTSFAGAEYFLYFDDTFYAYTNNLEFYDCNAETVQKGMIGYDTSNRDWGIQVLMLINQGISAVGENRQYPMIDLPRVEKIVSIGSQYSSYPAKYDTSVVKAVFHIWDKPSMYNIFDRQIDEYITRYSYLCKCDQIITHETGYSTPSNLGYYVSVPVHEQVRAKLLYGQRMSSEVTIDSISNSNIALNTLDTYAIDRVVFDIATNKSCIYALIGDRKAGRIITFYNSNDGVITLGSTQAKYESADYPCTFENKDGTSKTVTLNKYESATFVLTARDVSANKPKYVWVQII